VLAPAEVVMTLFVLALAAITHPRSASCPAGPGWMNNGIQSSGRFSCLHNPVIESDAPADLELHGKIYCAAGEVPVVVSERVVRCRSQP
jgi:hypothetical protein